MKIGFIGLGRMGRPIAVNIARGGYELVVFDPSEDACAALTRQGAKTAKSIADLTRSVDLVLTCLPGPPQVEEVALGEEGILRNSSPGQAYFDLSTNSIALVRRLHEAFAEVGVAYFDSPVSGGSPAAESRELVLWAGGSEAEFERYRNVLETFLVPRLVGGPGAGTATKLSNNMLMHTVYGALAECFSLGVKAGIDPFELWESMRLGFLGRQTLLNMVEEQFLPASFDKPKVQLDISLKDSELAMELGEELRVPLRLSGLVHQELKEAANRGFGSRDTRSFMLLQTERSGVEISVDPAQIKEARDRGCELSGAHSQEQSRPSA